MYCTGWQCYLSIMQVEIINAWMDKFTLSTGELYERFMLRAYCLSRSNPVVGADKRHYYLLYMIRNGVDLRETGYTNQLNTLRTYLNNGINQLLDGELHDHEREGLNKAIIELYQVDSEEALAKLVAKLMRITQRLEKQ